RISLQLALPAKSFNHSWRVRAELIPPRPGKPASITQSLPFSFTAGATWYHQVRAKGKGKLWVMDAGFPGRGGINIHNPKFTFFIHGRSNVVPPSASERTVVVFFLGVEHEDLRRIEIIFLLKIINPHM